jgi:uncharacterized protein
MSQETKGAMYFEIQVNDMPKALDFYGKVFGWTFEKNQYAPIEYYFINGAPSRGGILKPNIPKPSGPCGTNAFCCSFMVDDIDESTKLILELGGIVALPKMAIPGVCWQAYFLDCEKNVFGIFAVDENAK